MSFLMFRFVKKKIYNPILIFIGITCLVASCGSKGTYDTYKKYTKGFENAKKGDAKPSFWASKEERKGYEDGLSDNNSSFSEFEYTEEELRQLSRWKTIEQVVNDAVVRGDPDALFLIGLNFSLGNSGFTINQSKADVFFNVGASLGHSPSLEKIRLRYLEEDNRFLELVYINLLISMGHTEFLDFYLQTRSQIIKNFNDFNNSKGGGESVVNEIERIAEKKLKKINENQDLCSSSKNTKFLRLIQNDDITITKEDSNYNFNYWLSVGKVKIN
jgi:hypothetical protein